MRLRQLTLDGLGPFEQAEFNFTEQPIASGGELVLFEGPNGSGKSTLVEGIASLFLRNGLRGADRPLWRRLRGEGAKVAARLQDREGESTIVMAKSGDDGKTTPLLEQRLVDLVEASQPVTDPNRKKPYEDTTIDWAVFFYKPHRQSPTIGPEQAGVIRESPLSGAINFNQHANQVVGQFLINLELARTQAATYAIERSAEDPEASRKLAASYRAALDRIADALGRVLDRKVAITFKTGVQHATVTFDGEAIEIDMLGEGMRSTFAWLVDLLVRLTRIVWRDTTKSPLDQDFWLILDEIDESLHPTLQARIYPTLRSLFPNARIYATTHSPFAVASVSDGSVFGIRPDRRTRRVSGTVQARRLVPGQTLEYVVTDIFEAQAGFVDEETRKALADHKADVRDLQRQQEINWEAFFARRARLLDLNDEVRTVVAMQEVPVRQRIDAKLHERNAPSTDAS